MPEVPGTPQISWDNLGLALYMGAILLKFKRTRPSLIVRS